MGGGDQVFASQIKTKEEIFLGDTNPLKGQLYASHLLYKVKHPISTWRQSTVQNSFFFLGGGDQVFASQIKTKEEIFLGDTNPLKGQLYASHLLYKVKHPISTWRQSTVQNSFFFLGGGDQVFASQIKTKEEIFLGDTNPLKGQLYASHLLYKVKHLIST